MRVRNLLLLSLLLGLSIGVLSTDAPAAAASPGGEPEGEEPEDVEAAGAADGPEDEEEAVEVESLPAAEDAPAAAAPAAASKGSAGVQFVVTQKMKTRLGELGYGAMDIEKLHPERASAIISRGIRKPRTGVPASWNRGAKGSSRTAVGGGIMGLVGMPLKAVGVPSSAAAPLTLVLGGLAAALSLGVGPFGGAAVASVVKQALEEELEEEEVSRPARRSSVNPDDLWLDRQIDKAIDFLKALLGR